MEVQGIRKRCVVVAVAAISIIVIASILIGLRVQTQEIMKVTDYTACIDNTFQHVRCDARVGPEHMKSCVCYINMTLSEPIPGPVTLYYKLPDYDQTRRGYASSKDAAQLAGHLSLTPSASCGNYTYQDTPEGKKPIAPCGEIADSMFNDKFDLFYNSEAVPVLETGLLGITEEDKKLYHNPPGDLKEALKNFTRPKSWIMDTAFDTVDPSNTGFQNERFIGWMKTDLKIKPAWRLNHTGFFEHGLPAANYQLRVIYYPSNYVTGSRIAIISTFQSVTNYYFLVPGIILLIAVLLSIGTFVLLYVIESRKKESGRLRSYIFT